MDLSLALPTYVVTLREGFEAALVVGIVLACLEKAQQPQLKKWVYQGIGGGIVASLMVGLLLGGIIQGVTNTQTLYTPLIKEVLVALFSLVAIVMLSWMLIWMTQQAKSLKAEVEGTITTVLATNQAAGKAVFLLVFIAVLREGFETVLFIIAKFAQGWTIPSLGAIAGLLTAVIMGLLLFKGGLKLNIKLFFQVMGIFLLLIISGLGITVLKHLDLAVSMMGELEGHYANWCFWSGDSCILGPKVWNGSNILPDNQFPGIILKSLFGYRDSLYSGQVIAYILFLGIMGTVYCQNLGIKLRPKSISVT